MEINFRNLSRLNKLLVGTGVVVLVFVIAFFVWWNKRKIDVTNRNGDAAIVSNAQRSTITGVPCERSTQRPIAIMLAGDPIARPLSGLASADAVVEMPVTPNGITRLMAVFQCNEPTEIGSVRSARDGFISLAGGFDALYAHWGGEHGALARLNSGVLDNINALLYDGTTFYRKKEIAPPHNGFTTIENILERVKSLKYRTENKMEAYPHTEKQPAVNLSNIIKSVPVPYMGEYRVLWEYDETTKLYTRSRGGQPEIDRLTNKAVTASTIIIMETTGQPFGDQYVKVATEGTGVATVYQYGTSISGTWQKDPASLNNKLRFLDTKGKEIPLAPGTMWIEIITP